MADGDGTFTSPVAPHTVCQLVYSMLPRPIAMGLLLLRATAALAWAPAVRLSRSAARSGGYAYGCRHSQKTVGRSSSSRSSLSCLSPTSSAAARTAAVVGIDEGGKQGMGEVGEGQAAGGDGKNAAGAGRAEIQPLLRSYMDTLESTNRRR